MFGQPSTATSPFASPSATPFGSTVPTTNQGGFGSPAPSAFGTPAQPQQQPTTSGFGGFGTPAAAPVANTGAFGGFGTASNAAPTNTGFGGFGSPQQPQQQAPAAPPPTPFGGGGGLFGGGGAAPATGGLFDGGGFGAPAPATTFGGFGASATKPATQPATTGFGISNAAPAPTFGAPAGGGLFGGGGGVAPATGLFGGGATQPASTGSGIFGAGAAANTNTGGIFGATNTNANTAPATNGANVGSLAHAYQTTRKTDGNQGQQIYIQSIVGMAVYEGKSMEELRMEDYMAGNRGSQGGTSSNVGAFVAAPTPAPATGLFGATSPATSVTPGFGAAPATGFGGFGTTPAPAPLFGATPVAAPAGGGLFNTAPAAPPLFGGGGAAAPAPTTALFGAAPAPAAPAGGGLFGASTTAFGAAPATGSIFGAPPAAPTTSLFAPAAPAATSNLFTATAPATTAPTSFFGAPPAAPAAATGGLFGTTPVAAAPTTGLFGAPTTTSPGIFGAPAATQPATPGIFSAAPAFGSPTPSFSGPLQTAPTPAAPPGLFAPTAPIAQNSIQHMAAWGSCGAQQMVPPTADVLLAQQMAAVEQQKKELAVLEAWRGGGGGGGVDNGGGGSSVRPASVFDRDVFGGVRRSGSDGMESNGIRRLSSSPSSSLMRYPPAPRSAAKIRPRGFAPARSPSTNGAGTMSIGGGRRTPGRSPMMSPNRFLGSSAKHLVIKPGALTPKPKMRLLLTNDDYSAPLQEENITVERQGSVGNGGEVAEKSASTSTMSPHLRTPMMIQHGDEDEQSKNGTMTTSSSNNQQELKSVGVQTPNTVNISSPPAAKNNGLSSSTSPSPSKDKGSIGKRTTTPNGEAYDYYRMVVGSPESVENNAAILNNNKNSNKNDNDNGHLCNPALPKLTKPGYTITPSLSILSFMSEADLAAVQGFKVERAGYGSIAWDGAVDVRGCNLDSIISIETADVAVYDSEEADATKPAVGSKLNRPAVITIYDIFPKDGGANASMDTKVKYTKKITKVTKNMDADLLSYDASDGIWEFRVHHFSRYGLNDDDDDNDVDKENNVGNGSMKSNKGEDKVRASTDMPSGGASDLRTVGKLNPVVRESNPPTTRKSLTLTSQTGRSSRFSASIIDEETMSEGTTEEESVALMSDGEDQLIEAAENAYEKLTQSLQSGKVPSMSSNSIDVQCGANFFRDEGYLISEYTSPEVLPNSIYSAESSNGAIGISAVIARKCGVKTATSSSTDFGMRMGRSFRVGWRPDGGLVHPGSFPKGQCTLVQSRPALIDESLEHSEKKDKMCTNLLSVHLRYCEKLITTEDGCPFFSPHPNLSVSDNKIAEKKVPSILDGYMEEMNAETFTEAENYITKLTAQVLSLISILFKATPDKAHNNFWRKEALTKWLQKTCSYDVERDIAVANTQNDSLAAIFAALSGNDVSKAESISSENGLFMLSSLLTNPDLQACSDLMQQMEAWENSGASGFCPTMLVRIFALLSRNLDLEEAVYGDATAAGLGDGLVLDWKRRLGMLMWSKDGCPVQSGESAMSLLVLQYGSDVGKGLAPPPSAWYCNLDQPRYEKCVLFRLLELYATDGNTSLVNLIAPLGHTFHQHDVSKSFHFASALAALKVCQPLTRAQEAKLLETYAFQLLEANLWEWAIYILLCTFGDAHSIDKEFVQQRKSMAQDIVLRHYDPLSIRQQQKQQNKRRSFLEQKVGIPSSWFEMALSQRSVRAFDPHRFVQQAARFSLVDALTIYEEILPDIIINGGHTTDHEGVINFLKAIKSDGSNTWDNTCLSGVVYDFLMLSQNVNEIFTATMDDEQDAASKQRIDNLIIQAEQLQTTLSRSAVVATNTRKAMECTSQFFGGMTITSREMCLTELRSTVSAMVVHLYTFRMGGSPFERNGPYQRSTKEGRKLKRTSELMFAWSNQLRDESSTLSTQFNLRGVLESRTILRGIYGLA